MPADIGLKETDPQLYTKFSMVTGTLLGGPLAAGIMAAVNLNNTGLKSRAKYAVILGILGNLILYSFILFLPAKTVATFPYLYIPLIYTTLTYILIEILHHDHLHTAFMDGGIKEPFYKCILWGLSGLIVTIIVIMLNMNLNFFKYNTHEFGGIGNEMYYSKEIALDEVIVISELLLNDQYFLGDTSRSVFLIDEGVNYRLIIVMDDNCLFKPEINMDFRLLESVLNSSGIIKRMEIYLADEYLDTEYGIN